MPLYLVLMERTIQRLHDCASTHLNLHELPVDFQIINSITNLTHTGEITQTAMHLFGVFFIPDNVILNINIILNGLD